MDHRRNARIPSRLERALLWRVDAPASHRSLVAFPRPERSGTQDFNRSRLVAQRVPPPLAPAERGGCLSCSPCIRIRDRYERRETRFAETRRGNDEPQSANRRRMERLVARGDYAHCGEWSGEGGESRSAQYGDRGDCEGRLCGLPAVRLSSSGPDPEC
jgi:hypothetical protein